MRFLSERHAEGHRELISLYRNKDAADLVLMLIYMTHVWDDLIDKDKPVSDDDINYAFWLAVVGIPANPIYQAYFQKLHPIIESGVLNWLASNALERMQSPAYAREIAHAARFAGYDVAVMLASIVLPYDEAVCVIPRIKMLICPESINSFVAECAMKYDAKEI